MVLIKGDLHRGWSGCGTSNIDTMHCYIIFLVSPQTVENFSFMLTWCFSWRRKKDFSSSEHCILNLLICEL